ncbi:DUF7210 family protein [Brevibacillus formosus]|uniref:DUF7210 family protein n=1 Tax=Brevibacillus formosus TaxID=54913 RepID=UPI003F1C28DE
MSDEQKHEEKPSKKPKTIKVLLLKNIKYKRKWYNIGDEIEIDTEDKEAFVKAGIIEG